MLGLYVVCFRSCKISSTWFKVTKKKREILISMTLKYAFWHRGSPEVWVGVVKVVSGVQFTDGTTPPGDTLVVLNEHGLCLRLRNNNVHDDRSCSVTFSYVCIMNSMYYIPNSSQYEVDVRVCLMSLSTYKHIYKLYLYGMKTNTAEILAILDCCLYKHCIAILLTNWTQEIRCHMNFAIIIFKTFSKR